MSIARNSNLLGKVTILVMVIFVVNTAVALDGSGTEEEPWLIQSLDDFNDFTADANYWDDYTRLETDVNLAGRTYSTAVIAPDIINYNIFFDGTAFTGVFDGNDHKITDLTIDDGGADNDFLGLFGYIDNGEIMNLGLEGGSVSGYSFVGGLVGKNDGNVSNCYSTGDANGVFRIIGGLVGSNTGNVSNCYSTSCITGQFAIGVGGLVGQSGGTITNSYSTGSVSGSNLVGGLVGRIYYGSVWKCYSSGNVSGERSVGGLTGYNDGSILNSYSTGSVCGDEIVGGLVGWNLYGDVSNCYSTGDVNGTNHVGGSVGTNIDGSVSNCLWDTDTQTHGVTDSIGDNQGIATNVAGLPTTQIQTRSTFTDAGWDFINVWNIGENQTYPYLRVYLAADLNKDGIVNFLDIAITANQWMEEQF
jgi:hypothetical protein